MDATHGQASVVDEKNVQTSESHAHPRIAGLPVRKYLFVDASGRPCQGPSQKIRVYLNIIYTM